MAETKKEEKTKEKGSFGNTLLTIIVILIIVFSLVVSYTAYTTKAGSGVPTFLGMRVFAIRTDSMAPFFNAGDLVIDRVPDMDELEVGDVITFWTIINGQKVLNTHRIVEITDYDSYRYFDTKGDNNPVADTVGVHERDVVGVYKTHIKKLGSVLDFLETPKGFFIFPVLPIAIIFISTLVSFLKTFTAFKTEKIRLQLEQEHAAQLAAMQKPAEAPVMPEKPAAEGKATAPAAEDKPAAEAEAAEPEAEEEPAAEAEAAEPEAEAEPAAEAEAAEPETEEAPEAESEAADTTDDKGE